MNTATTITIAALAALTPTVTCLIGISLSRQDIRDRRSEVIALRNHVDTDLASIQTDLKQFYGMTTKLEGRMDEVSRR